MQNQAAHRLCAPRPNPREPRIGPNKSKWRLQRKVWLRITFHRQFPKTTPSKQHCKRKRLEPPRLQRIPDRKVNQWRAASRFGTRRIRPDSVSHFIARSLALRQIILERGRPRAGIFHGSNAGCLACGKTGSPNTSQGRPRSRRVRCSLNAGRSFQRSATRARKGPAAERRVKPSSVTLKVTGSISVNFSE